MRNSTTKPTINPGADLFSMRQIQAGGYRTGDALKNHIRTMHDGKIDPDCRACREILKKTRIEPQ